MAELRVPKLLELDVPRRFVSCEPLLGSIDLTSLCTGNFFIDALSGHRYHDAHDDVHAAAPERCAKLHWVIVGGESGPGARPAHPDWVCSLRNQCQLWAGTSIGPATPFFFKQWGNWAPSEYVTAGQRTRGRIDPESFDDPRAFPVDSTGIGPRMFNVGKKAAGAKLDWREHREFPQ